ncbi:MAG: hypothetical protein WBA93_28495 [Microcoleaceae cyanobacterium]
MPFSIQIEGWEDMVDAVKSLKNLSAPTPTPSPTPEPTTTPEPTPTPEPEPIKETVEIEFTTDKTDEYYGIVSTSDNYTLPEEQRVFSNSGWSVDEEGLYLSPSNTSDRLLLLSHQLLSEKLIKVEYDLFIPGNDFVASLFTEAPTQNTSYFIYSIFARRSDVRNYVSGSSQSYLINLPSMNFSLYGRIKIELNLEDEKLYFFGADSDYSVLTFLTSVPLPNVHTGFYIPGFSGVSVNASNRLKRVIIERYV